MPAPQNLRSESSSEKSPDVVKGVLSAPLETPTCTPPTAATCSCRARGPGLHSPTTHPGLRVTRSPMDTHRLCHLKRLLCPGPSRGTRHFP